MVLRTSALFALCFVVSFLLTSAFADTTYLRRDSESCEHILQPKEWYVSDLYSVFSLNPKNVAGGLSVTTRRNVISTPQNVCRRFLHGTLQDRHLGRALMNSLAPMPICH